MMCTRLSYWNLHSTTKLERRASPDVAVLHFMLQYYALCCSATVYVAVLHFMLQYYTLCNLVFHLCYNFNAILKAVYIYERHKYSQTFCHL
jgi:hypothetical protein